MFIKNYTNCNLIDYVSDLNKEKLSNIFNILILSFLTLQLSSIPFSIAVSSIAFGIWGGLWIVQIIFEKSINYDKFIFHELRFVNLFVLLYFLFEIISRIFAVVPDGAFIGLKRLLLFLIFYVTIIKVTSKKDLYRIILISLFAFSAISTYEIIKYIFSLNELLKTTSAAEIRIDYFAYPLTSGEMKLFILLSLFPVIISAKKIIVKKIYLIIVSFPILISMLLTQSRNVFLALFVCLLIYGFFNRKFLLAYIIILILGAAFLPQSYKDRVTSIFDLKHPSNESRVIMWETGLKMFKDHPFTGVGDNKITEVYKKYKPIEHHGEGSHLHSNYMMILATTGIFGLITYLAFFIAIFLKQIKYYKILSDPVGKAFILGSILTNIGFQIAGIFEWMFGDHEVMTVFFFLIALPFVVYGIYQKDNGNIDNF